VDRRIGVLLIAVPIGARNALGKVPGDREGRVAEESWLTTGSVRLTGLPELGVALDRETLERAQCTGATLGSNRLLDEIPRPGLSDSRTIPLPASNAAAIGKAYFIGSSFI
jgi:hypothetical protein